jgi:hypothetical protein
MDLCFYHTMTISIALTQRDFAHTLNKLHIRNVNSNALDMQSCSTGHCQSKYLIVAQRMKTHDCLLSSSDVIALVGIYSKCFVGSKGSKDSSNIQPRVQLLLHRRNPPQSCVT